MPAQAVDRWGVCFIMSQPPATQQLAYNQLTGHWEGRNSEWSLWMDDATFHAYVMAWLEGQYITQPTPTQLQGAVAHCTQFCYWKNCELNFDHHVHKIFQSGVKP